MAEPNWPKGFSWTKGGYMDSWDMYGNKFTGYVHAGPLLWITFNITETKVFQFYLGFRPQPPWPIGQGDEGLFAPITRLLKKIGWGNLGFALRIKEIKRT